MNVTAEELAAIHQQAADEYPRESCGVIVVRGAERRLTRCRNIQDELHAKDPVRHPRDARTAYYIDPQDLLRLGRLEAEGFLVKVIYHSHIDAGAYFSETDRRQALMGDEPVYPEAIYLVTSVLGAAGRPRVEATVGFAWDPARRDFAPVELGAPVSEPYRQ
ncbi:MAG: Mov34/MPN/PAD-1 family protein [Candidatus Rokuibacteriota bacterium]